MKHVLQSEPPSERIYKEIQRIERLHFDYRYSFLGESPFKTSNSAVSEIDLKVKTGLVVLEGMQYSDKRHMQ